MDDGGATAEPSRRRASGAAGGAKRRSPLKGKKRAPKFGDVIVPLRTRHDGWTAIRQRTFLRALSELGTVRDACALVGLSKTSAYRLRTLSPAFAAAWDSALEVVAPILEQAAFERGVEGWDEPVFHRGKICGYRKRYSDHALRLLLQRRRGASGQGPDLSTATREQLVAIGREVATRVGGHFDPKPPPIEEVRASILKKIEAVERADKRERLRIAAARGELWLAAGSYPPDATVRELVAKAAGAEVGADDPAGRSDGDGAHGLDSASSFSAVATRPEWPEEDQAQPSST